MLDTLGNVPASHDAPEGRDGPPVLAARPLGPRRPQSLQQTVAHLGELDAHGRARAQALARAITGEREQPELFVADDTDEAIPVRLTRIRLERGRTFGDVWLGWTLWRALRLDEALTRLLPEGREAVPWATMAAVLVLARLCEPSSELHIAETWYRGTALEDLLDVPAPLVNDDRLYRALDRLVAHKTALEQHLVARLGELFALAYDLLLYDVTSIYFEGLAEANPLARRGHSRDQPARRQASLPGPRRHARGDAARLRGLCWQPYRRHDRRRDRRGHGSALPALPSGSGSWIAA